MAAAALPIVVPVPFAVVEDEVARAVGVDLAQRSRPVAAARATVEEVRNAAVARSGQEDTITVRAGDELTVHTIERRPFPSTLVYKFFDFV